MADFVTLPWDGGSVRIEHRLVEGPPGAPPVVFLHEGLGSVAMWKDFPDRLCAACGLRGLVYSRPGYGRSSPRPADRPLAPDFMHRQAHELLPALLAALGVEAPVLLFGHSDGGSIALLYAARFPQAVRALVVLAPHIRVEPVTLASIRAARAAWDATDLPQRLARYHDDAESAFRGWNDIWLDPAFARWSIEAEIAAIAAPMLAIQGEGDEYGTLAQIEGIAQRVPQTRLLALPDCGHSPQRDRPGAVIAALRDFLGSAGHSVQTRIKSRV
jgi:pimeloyl-ACP methyl ester carboxylesterase